jgi:hypothetical protein
MRSALGGAACVCLLGVFATTALGATYNVNTTTDSGGMCGAAPASCTLRQAINTVNATPNPPDVIDVQAGHYILTLSDLQITNSVTIAGAGDGTGGATTTIDANGASRVFTVNGAAVAQITLTGMNIVNGNSGNDDGGGIYFFSSVTSVLNVSNVAAFTADMSGSGQLGGAIFDENSGTADVLNMTNSTISADSSEDDGGGIAFLTNGQGTATIDHSTISGDTSGNSFGGGLYFDGASLAITDSTISGNSAAQGGGGLFINQPGLAHVTATLTNDTIAGNALTPTGVNPGAGIAGASLVTAINTIVSGNTGATPTSTYDCDTTVASSDHSLEFGASAGCGFSLVGDPMLQALAANGGPTQTMALGASSAAIDAADSAQCLATDQRGYLRPNDPSTACDVGAYEFGAVPPAPPTASITSPANGATFILGQAVAASYACAAGPQGTLQPAPAGCAAPLAVGAAINTATLGPHTFTVVATNTDAQSASATSTYTVIAPPANVGVPSNTAPPAITGTPKAGSTLACSTGTWANAPTRFAYAWSRDRTPIAGATSHTYRVQISDEQLTLTCTVTAANAAGGGTPATSKGVTIPVPFVKGCPRATGKLGGATLGLVTLGMTRARARHAYSHSSDRHKQFEDFFCLTPIGVRVGYASPKLLDTLPTGKRGHLSNRVIWASTSSGYYAVHGIRPGAPSAPRARSSSSPDPSSSV